MFQVMSLSMVVLSGVPLRLAYGWGRHLTHVMRAQMGETMFTIILMLYLQQNLDVTLDHASARGQFRSKAECEAQALRLRGPVPVPRNYSAAWNDALCVPINRQVRVNEGPPSDLGKLLAQHPPQGCQADGAWRRVAELCQPAR
jgi:hypothetical protein